MSGPPPDDERVSFLWSPAIPGVELLDAQHTSRPWTIYNTTYAIAVAVTWCGEARSAGRSEIVPPGTALCTEPGDLHTTPRIYAPGAFYALTFEPSILRAHLELHDFNAEPHWRDLAHRMSTPLLAKIRAVVLCLRSRSTAMQLQTRVAQVVRAAIPELLQGASTVTDFDDRGSVKAKSIRECLTYEDSPAMDLETLAIRTGLTRYQVLRTFKKHYGVPPHVYQNHRRISRAAELLKAGKSPAGVAAELGFADQSHLTRLFRRTWGVTPGRYAKGVRGLN